MSYVATRTLDVESGRIFAPGAQVPASELNLNGPHDRELVASGALKDGKTGEVAQLPPVDPDADTSAIPTADLKGRALDAEAARLGVEGRSGLGADELRAAVAAARGENPEE